MNYNQKLEIIRQNAIKDMQINTTDIIVYSLFVAAILIAVSFPFLVKIINNIKYKRENKS